MEERYVTVTSENIDREHMCCAISDKKHQKGVELKSTGSRSGFLKDMYQEIGRRGKCFIEYSPLKPHGFPLLVKNYLYIHCFWVSGSYAGRGHGTALLDSCIEDAKEQHKSGICILIQQPRNRFSATRPSCLDTDLK
jgi:ribosomal protein S18 acetylase RimI-like enzyme